jgi:hypothetical protein
MLTKHHTEPARRGHATVKRTKRAGDRAGIPLFSQRAKRF